MKTDQGLRAPGSREFSGFIEHYRMMCYSVFHSCVLGYYSLQDYETSAVTEGWSIHRGICMIQIEQINGRMSSELQERLAGTWGSSALVTRGKNHDMATLKGFLATDEITGRLAGIALFRAENQEVELVAMDSIFPRRGTGTRLLDSVIAHFKNSGNKRLFLVITNDNVNAIRFYQKRGFNLCAFYKDGTLNGRTAGMSGQKVGYDGIPIRHELEFEMLSR